MKKILFITLAFVLAACTGEVKPVIGISAAGTTSSYKMNATYPKSVAKAGGLPVMLPMVDSEELAEELVAEIDGLIMTGGEDVAPEFYGEDIFNETVEINGPRDTSDMYVIRAALKRGIPILGICRGEQIVNVCLGGSLWQDLPGQVGEDVAHRQEEASDVGTHWIYVEKDSELHDLLGVDSVLVNSFHHQAVKQPAPGVKVSARSADGGIEAYEGKGVFCVQFHPECFVSNGDATFLPIFEELVSKAAQFAE